MLANIFLNATINHLALFIARSLSCNLKRVLVCCIPKELLPPKYLSKNVLKIVPNCHKIVLFQIPRRPRLRPGRGGRAGDSSEGALPTSTAANNTPERIQRR